MPTLLEQIRDGAIDSQADIGEVLRRCLALAYQLDQPPFQAWVQSELHGYRDDEDLPDYRVDTSATIEGIFLSPRGDQIGPVPIPPAALPEQARSAFSKVELRGPISIYTQLLGGEDNANSPLPAAVLLHIRFYENSVCLKAWQAIPKMFIAAAIDQVRAKVLGFVLELQKMSPEAGESAGAQPPRETVSHIVNTYITGNVGNVATGSSHFSQQAIINVSAGDFESLASFLREQRVAEEEISRLRDDVGAEPPEEHRKSLGPRVAGWIGRQCARLLVEVPTGMVAELVVRGVLAYYGLSH